MDERELSGLMAESLAEGLCELRGCAVRVQRVERTPFRGSSSFATERLRVLADGEWLDVFFKDLNPLHQLVEARDIREMALERSRRELHVYRNVLRGGVLGTPALYGWRWAPAKGLLWLFLEDVGPKRLSRLGDFSLWLAAARWSARLHAAARSLPARALDPLPQADAADHAQRADELERKLPRLPADHRDRIRSALSLYRDLVARLAHVPRGLVHNEFFGKNVIIRPAPATEPVAVIDWETAAIGPAYLDLVSISTGRWTLEQRLQMWRAYFEQAPTSLQGRLEWRDFCDDVHCVALHHALGWLNWWSNGDDVHIRRWLLELERVLANFGKHAPGAARPAASPEPAIHGGGE
jgi:hypothetical protein